MLWGLYFAALLILEKLFLGRLLEKLPRIVGHVYALFFVLIGWVIFNCTSLADIGTYLTAMFAGQSAGAADWSYFLWFLRQYGVELVAGILASTTLLQRLVAPWKGRRGGQLAWTAWLLAIFALSLLTLASSSFNPFIYFRF